MSGFPFGANPPPNTTDAVCVPAAPDSLLAVVKLAVEDHVLAPATFLKAPAVELYQICPYRS